MKEANTLHIGDNVLVTRANGETVYGVVKIGPLDFLRHIGEFYIIRKPLRVFAGRKDVTPEIGMYGMEQIETAKESKNADRCYKA